MRKITEIIVHCSDSPWRRNDTAADIDLWHKRDRGWACIGYHFVIDLDGTIEMGRPVSVMGAHCRVGGHNRHSIGVCYIGGRDANGRCADTRTPEQKKALEKLLVELAATHHAVIYGHHDFDPGKECPCFDARREYEWISKRYQ